MDYTSIEQVISGLELKRYTVRFSYSVVSASQADTCKLIAGFTGGFFEGLIGTPNDAVVREWTTIDRGLGSLDTEKTLSFNLKCEPGQMAVVYIDSIFVYLTPPA